MLLSEELAQALGERAGREETRDAEQVAGLLKALAANMKHAKAELGPAKLKLVKDAHESSSALLAAFVKHHWPKGPPAMDVNPGRFQKDSSGTRVILTALDQALNSLGDPKDLGHDEMADVKIIKATDALFARSKVGSRAAFFKGLKKVAYR